MAESITADPTAPAAAPTIAPNREARGWGIQIPEWVKLILQPITTAFIIAIIVMTWALVLRPDRSAVDTKAAEAFATPAPAALPALSYEWQQRRADASFDAMYRTHR